MYILPVICEVHAGMLNEKKSTTKYFSMNMGHLTTHHTTPLSLIHTTLTM